MIDWLVEVIRKSGGQDEYHRNGRMLHLYPYTRRMIVKSARTTNIIVQHTRESAHTSPVEGTAGGD